MTAAAPQPLFVRQRNMLGRLVEDWTQVTPDERKRLVASIIETITADKHNSTPRESWKAYVREVIPTTKRMDRPHLGV